MIYIASPYSNSDPAVEEDRFFQVCAHVAWWTHNGNKVFSPVAMTHIPHTIYPVDWNKWLRLDIDMLRFAGALWVLKLPGWEQSEGVKREMDFAFKAGIATFTKEPEVVYQNGTVEVLR